MEEKKNAKQVAMKPAGGEPKYTEEQLNAACQQVYQNMMQRMQQLEMSNTIKRLEFLFKVLEFKDEFDSDFIGDCVRDIKETLTVPEEESKEKEA